MSITIVSYRDDYFPGPIDGSLWTQVTNNFGIGCIKFLDDGVVTLDPSILVIFDETGDIPLADFVHPETAQYLFGCTGMNNIQELYPENAGTHSNPHRA